MQRCSLLGCPCWGLTPVATEEPNCTSMRGRREAAMTLTDTLLRVMHMDIAEARFHGVWLMLNKCALRAIDHDA